MYKHRRKIIGIMAIVLALLMVLSFVAMALPAFAVSRSELDALKKKQSQLAAEKKALDNELYEIRNDKKKALQEKANIDMQLEVLEGQIETNMLLIEALEVEIAQKTVEIDSAREDEAAEYELFKKRVRGMEEYGHTSNWAVLLGAESFSDFLSRAEIISDLITYDRELMQSLKETRENIEKARAALEADKEFYQTLLQDYELTRSQEALKKQEQEAYIERLKNEENFTAAELAEMAKQDEAFSKEIARMTKELAKREKYVGGDYVWPLPPGHNKITSPFGYRTHPTTGKRNSLHTGTDIGAKTGVKIMAANSGTIIVSTFSNSWGNYVMIDHGGGNVTLYAHMSKRAVSEGAEVKQGQVIGYVGSTGWSTGPHLHFEIRVNGTPTDPMKIFSLER